MSRTLVIVSLALLLSVTVAEATEQRCGWYINPTPGNLWLADKDGTWTITSQGQVDGPDADGVENAPDFDKKQFVETNNPGSGYGYGCACMTVETDSEAMRITSVFGGEIKPLSQCQADTTLPDPNGG